MTQLASTTLVAGNLDEARSAYAALQLRATSAEQKAVVLGTTIDALNTAQSAIVDHANLLALYTANQAQVNAQLTAQQASQVTPDANLQDFIANLGLAVALGEASMPDRAISSVTTTLQTFLTFNPGPDGKPQVGIRLYQPELGQPTALATTSFEIAKLPPAQGVPAPRNLYAVLQDKQAVFTNSSWARFVTGTPPSAPSSQIVTEIAKVFAAVGSWSFPFIIQEAAAIAALETILSTLIVSHSPGVGATSYAGAVAALTALAATLNPDSRSNFVAGDLFALSAALDATTQIAKTLSS